MPNTSSNEYEISCLSMMAGRERSKVDSSSDKPPLSCAFRDHHLKPRHIASAGASNAMCQDLDFTDYQILQDEAEAELDENQPGSGLFKRK